MCQVHFEFEFILKDDITLAETNIDYKTCMSIIRLCRKTSEDKGMSV